MKHDKPTQDKRPLPPTPNDFWIIDTGGSRPNDGSGKMGRYPTPSNPANNDVGVYQAEWDEAMGKFHDAANAYWAQG